MVQIPIITILIIQKNKITEMKERETKYALELIKEILGGQKNNSLNEENNNLYNTLNEEIKLIIRERVKQELDIDLNEDSTDTEKNDLIIKSIIKDELKIEIKNYLKDQLNDHINNDFKVDLKTEIKNQVEPEVKSDIDEYLEENSKMFIKKNDTINADNLQNQSICNEPNCIVSIQNNGKILPNIIFTKGMIIAWFGYTNQIPESWTLCDGTQGTPDLRNKFILGSDNDLNIGKSGGKKEITLAKKNLPKIGIGRFSTESRNGKYHHSPQGFIKEESTYSANLKDAGDDNWGSNLYIDLNEGMESSPINTMNPYYYLFYIMKT